MQTPKDSEQTPTNRKEQLTQSLQAYPAILTLKESATALSLSYYFLFRRKKELMDAGALIRIDGALRVEKNALIAWVCAKNEERERKERERK